MRDRLVRRAPDAIKVTAGLTESGESLQITRKSQRDWQRIAEQAAEEISKAPQGRKEAVLANIASRLDIGAQTLRTYLLAYRFTVSLPADLRRAAAGMPAIAVEIAARWSAYDAEGAGAAIKAYAAGKHSIRTFARAETAARRSSGAMTGKQHERTYRDMVAGRIKRLKTICPASPHVRMRQCWFSGLGDPSGKADFVMQFRPGKKDSTVAVLVVGPYSVPHAYDGRAIEWCLRALGLTYFHRYVALVLPPDAPSDGFEDFLAHAPSAEALIQLVRDDPGARLSQRR